VQINHFRTGQAGPIPAAPVQAAGIAAAQIQGPWEGPWDCLGVLHWGSPPRASRRPAAIQRLEGAKKLR